MPRQAPSESMIRSRAKYSTAAVHDQVSITSTRVGQQLLSATAPHLPGRETTAHQENPGGKMVAVANMADTEQSEYNALSIEQAV